jgi:hypothetical protein
MSKPPIPGYGAMRHKPSDIGGIDGGRAGTVPYYKPSFTRNTIGSGKTVGGYGNLPGGRSGQDGLVATGNPVLSNYGSNGMFNMNPMIKETPGFMTNPRLVYAKIIRASKQKYVAEQHKFVLMISQKESNLSRGGSVSGGYSDEPETRSSSISKMYTVDEDSDNSTELRSSFDRRYNQISIPAWNMIQQAKECYPESPFDVLSAEEVWRDWYIEGVVVTEEGENPVRGSTNRREISKERLINNVVRGFGFTFMIWPPHAPLTKLFLILKKVKTDGVFVLNPNGTEAVRIPGVGNKLTDRPFTLVPWCDSELDSPPLDVLKYTDEFGVEHIGKAIYVGRSCYGVQSNNLNTIDRVTNDITSHMTQTQSHIFVDA